MLGILLHPIVVLMTWAYYIMHAIVPRSWLERIDIALPQQEDVSVPGGWFCDLPSMILPRDSEHPASMWTNVLASYGLPGALSFLILRKNCKLGGVVIKVEPFTAHAWNHQTFYMKLDTPGVRNKYSPNVYISEGVAKDSPDAQGVMKMYMPQSTPAVDAPRVGERIVAYGSLTIPYPHGYPCMLVRLLAFGSVINKI